MLGGAAMTNPRRLTFVGLCGILLHSATVHGIMIGGGGSSSTDCLLAFDAPANHPAGKPKDVVCTDGDPLCDSDLTINGVCEIRISACANSTFSPSCSLTGLASVMVSHSNDNALDPDFDPDFQALQTRINNEIAPPTMTADDCANFSAILVPIKGPLNGKCTKGKKKLAVTSFSTVLSGKVYTDKDKVNLTCLPALNGCDPQQLFLGTFDRIQRQILNQSCALGGCHDSQSTAANLLLENGASYGNLVNAAPTNGPASAANWKRVLATTLTTGDPEMSLLYHKVTGDLPLGYGSRMPLDRRKLHGSLIQVLRLWIEAGAPQTGWVAGTD